MTLKERFLDAIIDGNIGTGLVVSRQDFMKYFSAENSATTGVFLSNSEMITGVNHSPTYTHFTQRVDDGIYRIHPSVLVERMAARGL